MGELSVSVHFAQFGARNSSPAITSCGTTLSSSHGGKSAVNLLLRKADVPAAITLGIISIRFTAREPSLPNRTPRTRRKYQFATFDAGIGHVMFTSCVGYLIDVPASGRATRRSRSLAVIPSDANASSIISFVRTVTVSLPLLLTATPLQFSSAFLSPSLVAACAPDFPAAPSATLLSLSISPTAADAEVDFLAFSASMLILQALVAPAAGGDRSSSKGGAECAWFSVVSPLAGASAVSMTRGDGFSTFLGVTQLNSAGYTRSPGTASGPSRRTLAQAKEFHTWLW